MKILLLGHKGYLGSYLHNKLSIDHDTEPVSDEYDYIINCIGKPNLEWCEENPSISYDSNYKVLVDTIKKYPKSKIIHFSSYYVYDDTGECHENSNVTVGYVYCKHKLMSEQVVLDSKGLVFRIGKLFGHQDIEKQNKLTEYLLKGANVTLDDAIFNPTSLKQVFDVLMYELQHNSLQGVFNLSNNGCVSHYEYGRFIKEHFNNQLNIQRVEKLERIFNNYGKFCMSTEKLRTRLELRDWETDLLQYFKEIE